MIRVISPAAGGKNNTITHMDKTQVDCISATLNIVKPLENQVFKCGGQGPPAHL
jgi:hypothetical protein